MAKKRIYQVAKEFRISSEALIGMLKKLGHDVKSHMNAIDDDVIEDVRAEFVKEKEVVKREYAKKVQRAVREGRKASQEATIARPPTPTRGPAAGQPAKTAPSPETVRKEQPPSREPSRAEAPAHAPSKAEPAPEASRMARKIVPVAEPPSLVSEAVRRRKKRRPRVDQKTVEETVRRTLAATPERRPRRRRRREAGEEVGPEEVGRVQIAEFSSVAEIAAQLDVPASDVIKKCLDLGLMVTINQRLDEDTILLLANAFGEEVEFLREYGEDILDEERDEALDGAQTVERAPVVAVMGHVDHGKTRLLDYIRSTNVMGGESGGITQHIGAYEVAHEGKPITFLDTPGHEAFTAMRARGAQITDVIVLVVAVDDGVMPQTVEAIDHARAAGVPIIVALNKTDLVSANPDKVRAELSNQGLSAQQWGGDTVMVETSAKTGAGVNKLLDEILFHAQLLELGAVRTGPARGIVVEVEKERGRGVVATVLVETGTLRVGDPFVVGLADGKVRALFDEWNRSVAEAGPSKPVQVSGLNGVPQAGDALAVVSDEKLAREISARRRQQQWERQTKFEHRVTLEDLHDRIVAGTVQELRIVIKGDVDGSVGALADALEALSTGEVRVLVIRKAVGAVTETDVLLAAASNAIIVGFHIGATIKVKELARREHVEIRLYKIIYEAVEDIRAAMEGMLEPEKREIVLGRAVVRETFRIPTRGLIGGCYVLSGAVKRGARARVVRNEMVYHQGTVESLKRFKDDVKEVQTGFECGMSIEGLDDIQAGDLIEVYEIEEIARKLGGPSNE